MTADLANQVALASGLSVVATFALLVVAEIANVQRNNRRKP